MLAKATKQTKFVKQHKVKKLSISKDQFLEVGANW